MPAPSGLEADDRTALVVKHVHYVLTSPGAKEEDLPAELRDLEQMQEVHSLLWGIRHFARALATGKLEHVCHEHGFVVGSLKSFQSNLRHLIWQAQCIAKGEYHHRVNFLSDFSEAFNQMAEQLDNTIHHLTSVSEEYKDLSLRDPLTGLHNRSAFVLFAKQLLLNNAGPQQNATIIMADIDKFKNINDTFGHLCGDEVLRTFSRKMLLLLRAKDICCRYGGEEFLILMPDTPLESGISIAERLRKAIEDMVVAFEALEVRITASFGLSEFTNVKADQSFEDHLNECIRIADDNMYKAKSAGRNQVIG
jgi:diguanylate cyclase (GGDEF)-like protein